MERRTASVGYAWAAGGALLCTLAGVAMRPRFDLVNVAMVYLLAVVIVALRFTLGPAIAAATHRVVRPGGAFLTYQFSTTARDLTARHFGRIETGFAWWNIPPCLLCWGWQES